MKSLDTFTTKKTTSLTELKKVLNSLGVSIVNNNRIFKDKVRFDKEGPYIINVGEDDVGTHWVGAVKNKNEVYYFDSFGVPAPEVIEDLFQMKGDYKNYNFNPYQIQRIGDGLCGQYVVLFLYWMTGTKRQPSVDKFKDFLLLLNLEQPKHNPELVRKYLKQLFVE